MRKKGRWTASGCPLSADRRARKGEEKGLEKVFNPGNPIKYEDATSTPPGVPQLVPHFFVTFSLNKYRLKRYYPRIKMVTPRLLRKKGGDIIDLVISFILSVLASIVAYYICKWLDEEED